jgi:hypothetical protein
MSQAPEQSSATEDDDNSLVENSILYKEFLAEREEILKHKWLESEKMGRDIGFERALLDWIVRYRSSWRQDRMRKYLSLRKPEGEEDGTHADQNDNAA